jgi:uncharacterized membrane protein
MTYLPDNFFAQAFTVILTAATPLAEARVAVPLALFGYKMSIPVAYVLTVAGNLLPTPIVYALGRTWLRHVEKRSDWRKRWTDRILFRARKKTEQQLSKGGLIALAVFIAVPLPMTGAWTGAIGAFAFGLPFKRALVGTLLGVMGSALIMTLATTGALSAWAVLLR